MTMIKASDAAGECMCCMSVDRTPHLEGLVQCSVCGHVQADTMLAESEYLALYEAPFFTGSAYVNYKAEAPALRRNFRNRLKELLRRHPNGGTLWEIGCAYGYFLEEAGRHFNAVGMDVSEFAINIAQSELKVDARCADYLTVTPPGSLDVVCMWDTIEHLQRPQLYIEKAAHDLRRGGTLAIETGDIGSWMAWARGENWRLIIPKVHIHHFTANSIRTLLVRYGFTNIRISYPVFWRQLDGMAYKVLRASDSAAGKLVYSSLLRCRVLGLPFPLQTFDLMTVYADKS